MSKKLTKITLVLIILLFLFTRFYKIGEIPSSVYWDEASIGYNAYSIIQTGKDEWGEFLPLHFRAFGEFKLPVYIYATAVSVKLFGLNEFAVRLPSVIFSLGVVFLTYFLAKRLFNNIVVALFSSFFVTISPWFFIFSRTGYEATAGLMFYMLAIYSFFLISKNRWYFLLTIFSFTLSAYSYNSFRIISPITFLILLLINKDYLIIIKKSFYMLILSLALIIISAWPIYRLYVYDAGISRLQAVGSGSAVFLRNYLSHFSLDFLLLGDKNLRSQQKGFGQNFPYDFLLLPLGLIYILKVKSKYGLLSLALVLISIVPAAITKESPHALRSIAAVPFISMVSAMGILLIKKYFSKKNIVELLIFVTAFLFFANYFNKFLNVYPLEAAIDWQYEYKKIFLDYKDRFDKHDQIIVSDRYAQPYIFALFYLKYDPEKFQKEVVRNSVDQWGFSTVAKFGKFEFKKDE